MRKIIFALLLCMISLSAFSLPSTTENVRIQWQIKQNDNPITGGGVIRKTPATYPIPPKAILSGHVLTFEGTHAEYTLFIIDKDGEEIYDLFIPENTSTIALPFYLSGEYELQIILGYYCFYGYIEL